ncbi:MAG: putative collagen-binding domain-containing protein, partial [Planctomycetota bacterium]|jgi:hypothetical protein
MWSGEVEEASRFPIWEVIKWQSADQMRHLKAFAMSAGRRYQDLIPCRDLVAPNRSGGPKGLVGWAYCARTEERDLFVLYFEKGCPAATRTAGRPRGKYTARWFNPRDGGWTHAEGSPLTADAAGKIVLPSFPGDAGESDTDWALQLAAGGLR